MNAPCDDIHNTGTLLTPGTAGLSCSGLRFTRVVSGLITHAVYHGDGIPNFKDLVPISLSPKQRGIKRDLD